MESVYEKMYDELKREFEQYKKESIKWSVEDFTSYELDGWQISEEQAGLALEDMIHHHDCNNGITWADVEYFLEEYGEHVRYGQEAWRRNLENEEV